MIASKCRVFVPEGVSTVLACIGSHTQATGISALRIASRKAERVANALGAHAHDVREPARDAIGIEALGEPNGVVGRRGRPEFDPDRVVHPGEELDVGAVRVARAIPDPEHVRRAVGGSEPVSESVRVSGSS